MLYSSKNTPEEIWNRIRVISEHRNRIKPMPFRNLETGLYEKGWVSDFNMHIKNISKSANYIFEYHFHNGLYGKTEKDFLKCIGIAKQAKDQTFAYGA